MTVKLTGDQVKAFWKYMAKKYGFEVIDKSSADEMKVVAWALDLMGIQNQSIFLNNYTTTLGKRVYVPFEIGEGTQAELVSQFATCCHEAQHVVQYKRNPGKFVLSYVSNDTARAHYEIDAYRATMEMHYYLTGVCPSPAKMAKLLKAYAISDADIKVAKKHFVVASKMIKRGGVVTGPSKVAIDWLKKNVYAATLKKVDFVRLG